jgi:hypothetical protein
MKSPPAGWVTARGCREAHPFAAQWRSSRIDAPGVRGPPIAEGSVSAHPGESGLVTATGKRTRMAAKTSGSEAKKYCVAQGVRSPAGDGIPAKRLRPDKVIAEVSETGANLFLRLFLHCRKPK